MIPYPNKEAIRQALIDRMEDLFRQAWGEPEKNGARDWRAKNSSARSMVMRGPKRGMWHDHKAGTGGDALDFVAVEFCGLSRAADDFPRVIDEAAGWCGLNLNQSEDIPALMARKAAREAMTAAEEAKSAKRNKALVEALQTRSEVLAGSPAAAYLAARGITSLPPGWYYLPPVPGLGVLRPNRAALMVPAIDEAGVMRGGQRILILPDGSKAPEDKRKPAFGSIGGCPARIAASIEGGPLYIAEGSETAAAIAQATGFEVWAVFGVSGFKTAPAPIGRKVVFCPDQDAAESSAANSFEAACIHHAARGVEVWIAKAPEDDGSKRDLNDTLQRAGDEAVANAVAAAVPYVMPETVKPANAAQGRVVLPKPAKLPDGKMKTLQAVLKGCDGPDALAVALAAAYCLLRGVPFERSIENVMEFLAIHLPSDAVTEPEMGAIEERLVWMQEERRKAVLDHVSLPASISEKHDLRQVTSLEALPAEMLHGVVCIRAPMGKGKTQIIGNPYVEWTKAQSGGVMAICHRVTLTNELARRLGLADYKVATAESVAEMGGVAVCLPSTTRIWIEEAMLAPRFVFIDEIAQVLQFLASEDYCRTRDADAEGVFNRLVQIVRDAEVVLAADAGLDARSISFLEHCRPGERFQVIEMQAMDEGKRARVITGAQAGDVKQTLVDQVVRELISGGKVWLAVESADVAKALEGLFSKQGFKAISITAGNKADERQAVFLNHAENASRLYDVVIASPAISSGISIEHRGAPHFTLGAYIGCGSSTPPADAVQQLGRVRYLDQFVIGVMPNNLQGGQTWQAIIQGQEGAASIEGRPAKATTFDGLVSDIQAAADNARADFGAGLWWMLEGQGWTLERVKAEDKGNGVKAAEDAMDEVRRAALIGAALIDDATAQMLKGMARGPNDEIRLEAWKIRKAVGVVDLDDAAIDFWDGGRGEARLHQFEDMTGATVERPDDSGKTLAHRKYRPATEQLYGDLLEGVDMSQSARWGPDVVQMIADRAWERREIYAAVGIIGSKYRARFPGKGGKLTSVARPTGKKATWMVKDILERAGLKLISRQVRLSRPPPFLVNTQRGVLDRIGDSDDNRQSVISICPASYAAMMAIIDRRAVFDLDAEIAARADIEQEPVSAQIVPHETLFWARAGRIAREAEDGRQWRAARDAERLMGAAIDHGSLALHRVAVAPSRPAPRRQRRLVFLPRLDDPENRIDAPPCRILWQHAIEDDGSRLIWHRSISDGVAEVFEQYRALDDPGNPDAWV